MHIAHVIMMYSHPLLIYASEGSPSPPPEEHEKRLPTGVEIIFAKMIPLFPVIKGFSAFCALLEVVVIAASATSSSPLSAKILSTLVGGDHPVLATSRIRVTLPFLASWSFAVSECLIRRSCYRTMGNLFAFELSIRKDHIGTLLCCSSSELCGCLHDCGYASCHL